MITQRSFDPVFWFTLTDTSRFNALELTAKPKKIKYEIISDLVPADESNIY